MNPHINYGQIVELTGFFCLDETTNLSEGKFGLQTVLTFCYIQPVADGKVNYIHCGTDAVMDFITWFWLGNEFSS